MNAPRKIPASIESGSTAVSSSASSTSSTPTTPATDPHIETKIATTKTVRVNGQTRAKALASTAPIAIETEAAQVKEPSRVNGHGPESAPADLAAAAAKTKPDLDARRMHWADLRDRLVEQVRRMARTRLMPYMGLVGVTEDERPVFFTPYHPKSGHVVFVFAHLRMARHYLDHLLYSFETTTPTSNLDLHIFTAHKPDFDDALFFIERGERIVMNPQEAWLEWAERVQQGIPNDPWRRVHVLVMDNLRYWANLAEQDHALEEAITTVLTHGLRRRVLVFATTTYRDWFTLPQAWRKAFRVGFYGGVRGLADVPKSLPRSVQELAPDEALTPSRDGRPVRFHSLAPEILHL